MKKSSLRERVRSDPSALHKSGYRCSTCDSKHAEAIEADVRELAKLREEGQRVTLRWFVEVHLREEYGLKVGREAVRRHILDHLKLKI